MKTEKSETKSAFVPKTEMYLKKNLSRFYFAHKEAFDMRSKALAKLAGKKWEPWNSEIKDIVVMANEDLTFHLTLKFANGERKPHWRNS